MARIYEQLAAADQPFALALIAGTKGSSPQRAGAKAMFFADGKIIGTLGGGCLEAEVQSRALQALKSGQSSEFEMLLDHDFGWDDGLICGGSVNGVILPHAAQAIELWQKLAMPTETICWGVKKDFSIALAERGCVEDQPQQRGILEKSAAGAPSPRTQPRSDSQWLYTETVSPPVELWIAGSGHVAQAVVPLAQLLDFAVTVFDDRPELANHKFFPAATKLRVGGWHELLKMPSPVTPAFGLVVTRGHQHDALVLSEWIRFPFAFLGMIGSRRKARIMRENFIKQKIATPEQFDRIACPVGLDISAVGTHEIAVSVLAQLIQRRAELNEFLR
jgi:xanthine dehydrogenase accessory factor